VALLDLRRLGRRHADAIIADRRHVAAVLTGEAHRHDALAAAFLQRSQDVGRAARGRDADEDIVLAADRLDLPREQLLVAVIVAIAVSAEVSVVSAKALSPAGRN